MFSRVKRLGCTLFLSQRTSIINQAYPSTAKTETADLERVKMRLSKLENPFVFIHNSKDTYTFSAYVCVPLNFYLQKVDLKFLDMIQDILRYQDVGLNN